MKLLKMLHSLLKMGIFHCYGSLPKGKGLLTTMIPLLGPYFWGGVELGYIPLDLSNKTNKTLT